MLIALVDFEVKPKDRNTALKFLLSEAGTVQKMDGCLGFLPYLDPQSETHVGVIHEWESGEGFAQYIVSPSFTGVGEVLRPLMTAPPSSRRYQAELLETVA